MTFLFTDIEGSTLRWDRDRAAMQDAVRRHDRIVRESVAAHGGYVFKTIGDAFCVAFDRPDDATHAALAAQRALAAANFAAVDGLRVRMALHTGTADERDGDYFGPAVNRVARLLAIGHGGQVLLSGIAADLVHGALASHVTLRDLGEHRLKDLARPERVHQLVAAALPSEFAPLRSLDTLANNLPRTLTSFVGRDVEVAEIVALSDRHRLVTVVGSGGVGKTRATLAVAADLLDAFPDGVWFVELAPLTDAGFIPSTAALAMGERLPGEGDALAHLVRLLREKRTLLVLDNCEHLVDGAALVVAAILRECLGVRVLASSRQPLGIAGEAPYRMPSLAVPAASSDATLTAREALEYAAVALFVERANVADRRFELTDDNAPIVAEICRRLDGIALAVELAAPRVKILRPHALRDKLDERFRLLTGGSRDALPRQQTLRALIDWSHDLLDERERAVFRRLSLFVDGFTLEGATAVASEHDLDEFAVFDVLTSLVDQSLVLAEHGAHAVRYRMLESTRAYGREKLEEANEREVSALRHLRHLHDTFAALRSVAEETAHRNDLHAMLAAELEDVRSALDFGLRGDVTRGAALLGMPYAAAWRKLGLEREFVARAERYLAEMSPAATLLRARLWSAISFLTGEAGHTQRSMDAASLGLDCARASGDARTLFDVLETYVQAACRSRRFADAEAALAEAEALPHLSPQQPLVLLEARGLLLALEGDGAGALAVWERVVAERRTFGDDSKTYAAALNFAENLHHDGQTRRAVEVIREILVGLRASTNSSQFTLGLGNLAGYLAAIGEYAEAADAAREVVRIFAATDPASPHVAIVFEHLALALAAQNDPERAARLEGYADAALAGAGYAREYTESATFERLAVILGESLPSSDLERLLVAGAALTARAAIALALEEPAT